MLPFLKRRGSLDKLVIYGTLLFAAATLAAAIFVNIGLLSLAVLVGGFEWIVLTSSLNVATRTVVPAWVQARCLAVYLLVFQGGMALGSLGWGSLAAKFGVRAALVAASAALVLTVPLALRYALKSGEAPNLSPAGKWPEPEISPDVSADSTAVLVTVEYHIDPRRSDDFVSEMRKMEHIPRRDGALQWGLFIDPAGPGKYLEEFFVETWLEHRRQHERFTVSDQELQERILALHTANSDDVDQSFRTDVDDDSEVMSISSPN